MRKNSIKNIRINAEVQRELSRIIQQEIKDPRIHPMTTVVMAEVTPDLKYCKAYISVLGNEEAQKSTMEGLKNAKPYIRRMLASSVNLRNTPAGGKLRGKGGISDGKTPERHNRDAACGVCKCQEDGNCRPSSSRRRLHLLVSCPVSLFKG